MNDPMPYGAPSKGDPLPYGAPSKDDPVVPEII